jgi:hypothetical protein
MRSYVPTMREMALAAELLRMQGDVQLSSCAAAIAVLLARYREELLRPMAMRCEDLKKRSLFYLNMSQTGEEHHYSLARECGFAAVELETVIAQARGES